jgi:hypothetical protein
MKGQKAFLFIGMIVCLTFAPGSEAWAKINKGVWYHQQPTSVADSGPFYGGSATYEGFCGTSALTIGLHYFIPNIHRKMTDLYGSLDYHSGDSRGGLKTRDPYMYSASSTYTFIDFLSHKWLGRHITTSGASYSELVTILNGVDSALTDYSLSYAFVSLAALRSYLDNGYLGCMNTLDGHYVTIVGWDGSTTDANARYYYYWDSWKTPLGLSSYTYVTSLVGNKNNYGTAQSCNAVKITANQLSAKFKDQRGDGTMLVYKYTPNDAPATAATVTAKAIWLKGVTAREHGVSNVVNECAVNGITDIFLMVKGTDGSFSTTTLDNVIHAAHPLGIKVHAWVVVLQDHLKASTGNYTLSGTDWINATDANYRNYIINSIITPLVRDHEIDGVHLDCIRYPGNANQYSGAQNAITTYCSAVRNAMNSYKPSIPLSAAIIPEGSATATYYGQNTANISPYLTFITPMTYTHNYEYKPAWVGTQVAYFVGQCASTCGVWPAIQTYDDDGNFMTPLEMKQCVDYARANGGTGVAFFSYPLTDYQWEQVNTWNVSNPQPSLAGRITEVSTDASRYFRNDPLTVTIAVKNTGTQALTNARVEWTIKDPNNTAKQQFVKTIASLAANAFAEISDVYTIPADAPTGAWSIEYYFKKSDGTVFDSYAMNGHLRKIFNVEGIVVNGRIESQSTNMTEYYPDSTITPSAVVKNNGNTTLANTQVQFQFRNPDNTIVSTQSVIISSLAPAETFTAEVSYTLGAVPLDVDGSWTVLISFMTSDGRTLDSRSDLTFLTFRTVSQAQYQDMADRCADFMDANYSGGYHTYPNYVNVGDGRTVSLAQMADILSRALRYYKQNGALPTYIKIRACAGQELAGEINTWMWKNEGRSDDDQLTWYDVSNLWDAQHYGAEYSHTVPAGYFLDACERLAGYIDANGQVPNYVRVYNDAYSPARWETIPVCQFLYSMSRYIRYYVDNSVWPATVGTKHMTVPSATALWEQNPDH